MNELKPNAQNIEDSGLTLPKPEPTSEEKRGELAKTLHKGGVLPQLRTYQGDVAEFIKSKDESLADVALKRQEKKEEEKKETKIVAETAHKAPTKNPGKNISTNFLMYIIGIVLLVGTLTVATYILFIKQSEQPIEVAMVGGLLRSDDIVFINLSSLDKGNLASSLANLRNETEGGGEVVKILEIKIGDSNGTAIETPQDFIQKFDFSMPAALVRSLDSDMSFGLWQGKEMFLIFKTKDFGIAWNSMLEWETSLLGDFGPLLTSSTTASTYNLDHTWKDIIVKNKDTRGAIDQSGKTTFIYTFIDKNTILITESSEALKAILDKFVEGNTIK